MKFLLAGMALIAATVIAHQVQTAKGKKKRLFETGSPFEKCVHPADLLKELRMKAYL